LTDYKFILYENRNNYCLITLNRPEVLNALNVEMRKEIIEALSESEKDAKNYCVVITGSGEKAFSAGADLKTFQNLTPIEAKSYLAFAKGVTKKIESLRKPVIAAVNGYAIGAGLELVLACDLVIAAEDAKFGQGEINVGLIPGAGGTQRLPKVIGLKRAKEMVYTGEPIDAKTAMGFGIVNRVVESGELMDEVERLVQKIAAKSQMILRIAKESLNESQNFFLRDGLDFESQNFALCFATQDQKEGITAFLERRKPEFVGR
jgi:enoyl-CoA hydratase